MWRWVQRPLKAPLAWLLGIGRYVFGPVAKDGLRAFKRPAPALVARLVALGAVTYAVALWKVPDLLGGAVDNKDRHNARLLVVSIGGAIVLGIGLLYTARNYELSRRGQMTDRFTKALERLDSEEMYIRIGGIHALEHVMRDSPDHHDNTVEVLLAFVRAHVPASPQKRMHQSPWMHPVTGTGPKDLPAQPKPDVQAALTALGNRPLRQERMPLDLSELYLRGADLRGANLSYAIFRGATLDEAEFDDALLMHTNFFMASLADAVLNDAQLQRANFHRANLNHAELGGADLYAAYLVRASLRSAEAVETHFMHANLSGADLTRTNLARAKFFSADLTDANLTEAGLSGADLTDTRGAPEQLKRQFT